jgi:hypothetical protein
MKKLILSMLVFVCTSLLVAAGNNLKGMVSETDGTGYFAVVSEQNSAEIILRHRPVKTNRYQHGRFLAFQLMKTLTPIIQGDRINKFFGAKSLYG